MKVHHYIIILIVAAVIIAGLAMLIVLNEEPTVDAEPIEGTACTPESRQAEFCAEIYQPVCGVFDPAKINCVTAPCGKTYSNKCFACMDENVKSYTEGECR